MANLINLFLIVFLSSKVYSQQARTVVIHGLSVPIHNAEKIPQNEAAAIEDSIQIMNAFFNKQYQNPTEDERSGLLINGSRRGVHPVAHACLKGTFNVSKNLPERLKAGIFQPGQQYDIITRFSNALPRGRSEDGKSDSRGLGIKVLGLKNKPLYDQHQTYGVTQDFTLNTTDTFFATDAKDYADFMRLSTIDSASFEEGMVEYIKSHFLNLDFDKGYRILKAFLDIRSVKPSNLLDINYFSISPFQNGGGPSAPLVKYIIQPCKLGESLEIDHKDPFFLRNNLIKQMNKHAACFNFFIQERNSPNLQIEDLTKPWSESVAPVTFAGRLILPKQELMNEVDCEKMVINPWNTLPEHKPVGAINRLRFGAYQASIELRKNAVVTEQK